MNILRVVLAFAVVGLAAHAAPLRTQDPGVAESAPAAGNHGCLSDGAEWPNDTPAAADDSTQVTNCMVAGHPVRINAANAWIGSPVCAAVGNYDAVSAWVDGVKVVDARPTDAVAWCFAPGMDGGKPNLVNRITIDGGLRLTVCETLHDTDRNTPYTAADLKPGQSNIEIDDAYADGVRYGISTCAVTLLSTPPTPDPLYGVRTEPGLVADLSTTEDCTAISNAFGDPDSPILSSALDSFQTSILTLEGKPFETGTAGEQARGAIRQYELDLDGDGVYDTVSQYTYNDPLLVDYPAQYGWRDGKTGEDHVVTGERLGFFDHWEMPGTPFKDAVRDTMIFVDIGGRIYLYDTSVGIFAGVTELTTEALETKLSGIDEAADFRHGTRRAYILQSDGAARIACQWGPLRRPEAFM